MAAALPPTEEPSRVSHSDRGKGTTVPVFVRVKPLGAGGGGTEAPGERPSTGGAKTLAGWQELPPRVVFDGGGEATFPAAVIGPERTQTEAYERAIPPLADAFLRGHDVNLIAYGPTGSGKTHTLFGPPGLLGAAGAGHLGLEEHDDYGMFPRTAMRLVRRLQAEGAGQPWVLTASAVELHMGDNLDLLDGKSTVYLDKRDKVGKLYGATEHRVERPEDLLPVFAAANSRTTCATGAHDASSRSHCFVVLTLWRLLPEGGVRMSRFQFADLAGSERQSDSTGGEGSAADQMRKVFEGLVTNFTLLMLTQVVEVATRNQKETGRTGHVPVRRCDLTMLLSNAVYGRALMACVVTVSQAPRNGTKGWLATQWGEKLSALRLGSRVRPAESVASILARARSGVRECEAALRKINPGKFARIRQALLRRHRHELEVVELLTAADGSASRGAGKRAGAEMAGGAAADGSS